MYPRSVVICTIYSTVAGWDLCIRHHDSCAHVLSRGICNTQVSSITRLLQHHTHIIWHNNGKHNIGSPNIRSTYRVDLDLTFAYLRFYDMLCKSMNMFVDPIFAVTMCCARVPVVWSTMNNLRSRSWSVRCVLLWYAHKTSPTPTSLLLLQDVPLPFRPRLASTWHEAFWTRTTVEMASSQTYTTVIT